MIINTDIRVFVSSTFRDMHIERNELVKKIFPSFREKCQSHGYNFMEIDLRWGITEEEANQGQVIPICLEEINRCRPFFICILGDRYGWCVDEFSTELLEQYPWLEPLKGRSVTEIEITYAALAGLGKESEALFYFREPQFYDNLPEGFEDRSIFFEKSAVGQENLKRLKKEIKASGFPFRNYSHAEELGNMILEDLSTVFRKKILAHQELKTSLDSHEIFALEKSQVFRGRTAYFDQLNRFLNSNYTILVLTGEEGIGKTSLLSAWWLSRTSKMLQFIEQNTQVKRPSFLSKLFGENKLNSSSTILYFVGATHESSSWQKLVCSIIEKGNQELQIDFPIPQTPQSARIALHGWFSKINGLNKKITIIIDGVDNLKEEDQALDLTWLPSINNSNIKLIFTSSAGLVLEKIKLRQPQIIKLKPLHEQDKKAIINDHLEKFGKSLNTTQINTVLHNPQAGNPLFLKSLLEELRIFGHFEQLDDYIHHYANSENTEDLFQKILKRIEQDFEVQHHGLVGNILSYIWSSRNGLSEKELLDLEGEDDLPLPTIYWSPIYLALKSVLISRNGFLDFGHQTFSNTVEQYYLHSLEKKKSAIKKIQNYFSQQDDTVRKIHELPWALSRLGSWNQLAQLLSEPSFFKAAWKNHRYEIQAYWSILFQETHIELSHAYASILMNPEQHLDIIWELIALFDDLGYLYDIENLLPFLEQKSIEKNDELKLQASYGFGGKIAFQKGDFSRAFDFFQQQEHVAKRANLTNAYACSLGNQASILRANQQLEDALDLYQEEEKIYDTTNDLVGLGNCLANQGAVLLDLKSLDEALALFIRQEELSTQLSDYKGMLKSWSNQALIFGRKNNFKKSIELLNKSEELSKQIGDLSQWFECLRWKSIVFQEMADYDNALEVLEEQERLCLRLNDPKLHAINLSQQAQMYAFKLNQPRYAMRFIEKSLQIVMEENLFEIKEDIERRFEIIEALT